MTSSLQQATAALSQRFHKESLEWNERESPSEWLETHFYIPEPRDQITGAILPPGPIQLAPHQKELIDEALRRDENGHYVYTTIIWSAPKKSGKSAIASGVTLYQAHINDYSRAYCLANDGKQSADRIYGPIYTNFGLHRKLGGIFEDIRPNLTEVTLPNYSKLEAIPCDAAGEAGSEPTMSTWSELWAFESEKKRRLWTEMTVPPTKFGRAIRWVESYAGFTGSSPILERLYETAVMEGEEHPGFTHLRGRDGEPVVWTNKSARIFCYWDTHPRMVWQTEAYYEAESKTLDPAEFRRIHQNQWVSPTGRFIDKALWDACGDSSIPPLRPDEPVIVGIDAATESDCAVCVAVSRDPRNPNMGVVVRDVRIFKSTNTSSIILSSTIGRTLIDWFEEMNVVCTVYDPYQMKNLIQNFRQGTVALTPRDVIGLTREQRAERRHKWSRLVQRWYFEFSQGSARALADKQLYDLIMTRSVKWPVNKEGIDLIQKPETAGSFRFHDETLYSHVVNAGANRKSGKVRLIKLANSLHIDAAVALSMAASQCLSLNIGDPLPVRERALKLLEQGKISQDVFMEMTRD